VTASPANGVRRFAPPAVASVAVAVLLIAAATLGSLVGRHRNGETDHSAAQVTGAYSLSPANFAAVLSRGTVVRDHAKWAESVSQRMGVSPPHAGAVHQLGMGETFAWVSGSHVCWFGGYRSTAHFWASECVASMQSVPIDWLIAEPANRPIVEGLSVNGVRSVTVSVKGGRTATGKPVANFYYVLLPHDALPWNVTAISAKLATGKVYLKHLSLKPPSAAEKRSRADR
jgi:hypothetical protein